MSTIRPADFPRISRDTIDVLRKSQQVDRQEAFPRKDLKAASPAKSQNGGKSEPFKSSGATAILKTDRQAKIEKTVEILRTKTIELYHPQQKRKIESVGLGQFVDIKA